MQTGFLSKVYFYRNDGTMKAPLFKQVAGANNPLNKVGANTLTIPYFIDINADGDYDCFIGEGTTGAIIYYETVAKLCSSIFEYEFDQPSLQIKFFWACI